MTIDAPEENAGKTQRQAARLIIAVAVALHLIALIDAHPLQSANDRSRWCTVWSLVEQGTFQIDEIRQVRGWDSIDIIYDGGHFYSTKPPLLSVLVAGVTWCVQRVTGWNLLDQTHQVTTTVLCLVNILPFAFSLLLLSRLLDRTALTEWCRLFVLTTVAFGTLVTPFLMTLNNHTVAVFGITCALYALERILCADQPCWSMFALCGIASGWAASNELPAAAFGLATFLISLRKSVRQTICWYVPAAIIPLAAFLATNVIATGSWKPTYAGYGSAKYNYVIDGVPSYWMEPHGVDRNLDSPLMYFVHCTVGHHGIFSLTPLFVLSVVGWLLCRRQQNAFLRTALHLGALLTVINLAFFMTRTQNYNFGGVSCALRWALWLVPLWLIALIPVLDAMARTMALRAISVVLLIASMVSAWLPIGNPWQQPWLFHKMTEWHWIDYSDKNPALPRKLWSWFPSIPKATATDPPWIEFSSTFPDGAIARRRISVEPASDASDSIVNIRVEESIGDLQPRISHQFSIDRTPFDAGGAVADFMSWKDPDVTSEQQQTDFTFVRGLPLKRDYRGGKIRYLKTSLRTDAFRCQLAAAGVEMDSDDPEGRTLRFRCDVWLCDELPFGVAQVDYKVIDPETDEVLDQQRWTVTGCHPEVAKTAPPISNLH